MSPVKGMMIAGTGASYMWMSNRDLGLLSLEKRRLRRILAKWLRGEGVKTVKLDYSE